jgi:signal transduction histidine kinase/DNA-binding response OmpR family regulator
MKSDFGISILIVFIWLKYFKKGKLCHNYRILFMKPLSVGLILLILVCRLFSQKDATISILTVNDGLSQGMIFDILQSKDGFIWMATKDGLNRYDGSRFEVFSPDPFNPYSISSSEINSLFEDRNGLIWVSTPEQLEVFDPTSKRFYHLMSEGQPITSQYYPSFAQTPDGAIWLTNEMSIWKINLPNDFVENPAKSSTSIVEPICKKLSMIFTDGQKKLPIKTTKVLYSQTKKLLLGTNLGLFRLDPASEKLLPEYITPDIELRSVVENKIGEILMIGKLPNERKIWIWISGTTIRKFADISYPVYPRTVFSFDEDGYIWTFLGKAIQKWELSAFFNQGKPELEISTDNSFLKDNFAYCTKFLFDQSGVGWVGTNGFGIIKINNTTSKFKTFLPDISQRILLEAPDGGLYSVEYPMIKYSDKAFDKHGLNTDYYGNFHPFDNNSIGRLAVCFDGAGNGWSSSREDSLLYRMDAMTKKIETFPWRGVGLMCDRPGFLWSVDENGLYKFDPDTKTQKFHAFDKPQKRISDYSNYLYKDIDGTLWIFGFNGLIRVNKINDRLRFEYFTNNPTDRSSISSDIVLSVMDDPIEPNRYLWVGTKSGGLNRMDKKSGTFKQYKKENGLPDNVIYGILAENTSTSGSGNHIWLSTNKGLCRFDVRAETTRNFSAADGLQDNEFNSSSYLKTSDGTMIFGGVKGLTVFHPDSLKFNEHVPQIHIVGVMVNNQKYDLDGKSSMSLSYDQNLLNFDFAALEFTNPTQNQYRYQLIGVDKEWVTLGNKNSIQFANLAPGNYTFKVLGSNNDGIWSDQPATIKFTIRPPWYSSWWAYGFYIVLLAFGVRQFYFYKLSQRLEHQEKIRLQEMDEFKNRFFTNITHEFRTPLTVMLGSSEQLIKEEPDEIKSSKLSLIKRSGENLLRLINQILDLTKLESNTLPIHYIQGDILTFIRYIAESLHSFVNAQNILLKVESEQSRILMDYDPDRILQIIHNLLSNAVKFTPSGGKVVVRTECKDKWLHISVSDTGSGIPPDQLPHLFERFFQANNQEHAKAGGTGIGLSLTRELVKAMGGDITVKSILGNGSTFYVKLPVTNNCYFDENTNHNNEEKWSPPGMFSNSANGNQTSRPSDDISLAHILVIEDNADVAEYLSSCLKDQYSCEYAYNGQAGIERALEKIPDIIVSDVMMPIKDGFEVVEKLKNDERTSHIPIILLTAKADVQSRLLGLKRGADSYISKPFHQEELLVTINNLLESRRKLQQLYLQKALIPSSEVGSDVDIEDSFLQKLNAVIEENYTDEDFGLTELCQKIRMSRSQLFRKMKALTNIAPSDLIRKHRLNKAKDLLKSGEVNVAEATWKVGFKDPSYFSKLYQEEFGETPSATRK